ncbi:chymotrypsin B-like isoform X4 [Biomphalaria glabrata]|uniref:Chymotrypsin B-like isoform X4 n=1 Tax=Biomphalaria glabrata TaxID=6526 RepID=A0A9W3B0E8_BIOGL|nr:chymotrypsin B-like isoform X4 [Biomphalaria glabrata]
MNLLIATSLFLLLTDIDVTSSRARHSIGGFIKRIIYGTNAELYDIPSQVGIFYRRENNWTLECGGVLIKPDKVAQLAVDSSDFFDKLCIVSGWGKSNYTDISGKNRLQKTSITLLSKEECISNWKLYSDRINDRQLVCVLDKQGEPSIPCNGDSGGPLFCGPRLDQLVGVTSFGRNGCPIDSPVVYTDVSQCYRSWIETNS